MIAAIERASHPENLPACRLPTLAASANTARLEVTNVTVRFGGITALQDVSFAIEPGVLCALIGPNGAGKTTLLNCLSRLYKFESGDIAFGGVGLRDKAPHDVAPLGIGRTFQNLALFRSMTVEENVAVGCHSATRTGFLANAFRGARVQLEERQTRERVSDLLQLLELDGVRHTPVGSLPFGTQKRVELARALAANPKLLLLDEPACGLNHAEVAALATLIRDLRDRFHLTVLLIEHHMGLVMSISEQVVALNFGRKIAEGTADEVRRDAGVIQAYLGGSC
jgi:branched-chain amino acid transport system ATP-binding protein